MYILTFCINAHFDILTFGINAHFDILTWHGINVALIDDDLRMDNRIRYSIYGSIAYWLIENTKIYVDNNPILKIQYLNGALKHTDTFVLT